MAANPTPKKYSPLIAALKSLSDGMLLNQVALGIKQNTSAAILSDRSHYITSYGIASVAEANKVTAQSTLVTSRTNAHDFVFLTLGVLRPILGTRWNLQWVATGMPNQSVSVPTNDVDLLSALTGLNGYFTANPTQEVASKNLTAAEAETLDEALSTAISAVNSTLTTAQDKFSDRDADEFQCKKRFRNTIDELDLKMTAIDPRWHDFGLNRPADPSKPKAPLNIAAATMGPNAMNVTCDPSPRALHYRYFYRIIVAGVTTPPPYIFAGMSNTPNFLILALPTGALVEMTASAVNGAGESKVGVAVRRTVL